MSGKVKERKIVNQYRIRYMLVSHRNTTNGGQIVLSSAVIGIYDTRAEAIAVIENHPHFDIKTQQELISYAASQYKSVSPDVGLGFEIKEVFTKATK